MSGVVGPQVRPQEARPGAQLLDEADELRLRVLPGEVRVRLREPGLREQGHHRRAREGLGEEDGLRVPLAHLADQPLPERDGLRVRVVDAEHGHAGIAPAEDDVEDRLPEPLSVARLPVEVVDVLVALGRVLRVLQRPVRAVLEPLRMPREPRVVGRHLEREVERELHALTPERGDERREVGLGAETRVDRVVASLRGADRPRAPDVAGLGPLGVVAPLAVRPADRMDRREVDDVEPELGELGDDACDARQAAPRAREQLVPGACPRALPLDVDLEGGAPGRAVPVAVAELGGRASPLVDGSRPEQRGPLGELAAQVGLARGDLAVVLVEPAGVAVDPGLDLELPAADRVDLERAREAVVAERRERRLAPASLGAAVADDGPEDLVAVADDGRRDLHPVADARLRRPAAAIDLRRDLGDGDPFGRHPRHTVNSPACGWNDHWGCSSIRRRSPEAVSGRRRSRSSTGWPPPEPAGGRSCR